MERSRAEVHTCALPPSGCAALRTFVHFGFFMMAHLGLELGALVQIMN